MTAAAFDAQRFDAIVKQHAPQGEHRFPEQDEPESLFLFSYMLYDATRADAERAVKKLRSAFIDLNELRVSRTDEVVSAIGVRYPGAEPRCEALRATLNDLYNREHAITFERALGSQKRDARQYLSSLDACPPFVWSRLLLLSLGAHAVPLDNALFACLQNEGVFLDGIDFERALPTLERHVKAADALATHAALESLRDSSGAPKATTSRKPAGRKASA